MSSLLPPRHLDTTRIVQASRSSFAPAFRLLPRQRRCDLEIFYAFCRTIDDLADQGEHPLAVRLEALETWREGFRDKERRGLPGNLRSLISRHRMNPQLFLELLEGTATDLAATVEMPTWADLDLYCHRVAGVVGQLCLSIFGADPEKAKAHAEVLGRALQYTNILRDTAPDLKQGRLYYPLDELAAWGLDRTNFQAKETERQAFLDHFASQANQLFALAAAEEPRQERSALRPARMMAAVYARLLRKMRSNGLRVMERRYRLSPLEKLGALTGSLIRG